MNKLPSVKDLQSALLRELAQHLEARGFRSRLSQQSYSKNEGDTAWVVHVAFVRHEGAVDATLDLGLRIGPVQELLRKSGYGDGKGVSIGAELGNLIDGRPRRWTIHSEADATEVAKGMLADLEKFAFRWFDRYSEMIHVLNVLAANDSESRLISPLRVNRCLTVVALATLTVPEPQARTLADQCREYLVSKKDPQLGLYDQHVSRVLAERPNP